MSISSAEKYDIIPISTVNGKHVLVRSSPSPPPPPPPQRPPAVAIHIEHRSIIPSLWRGVWLRAGQLPHSNSNMGITQ